MNYFTAVAGLAAVLLASSGDPAVRRANAPEPPAWREGLANVLSSDTRKIKVADKLSANADEQTRLVVPDRCEAAGEADLRSLASTGIVEEVYVLVFDLCLWVEVGYNRTQYSARMDDKVVRALLEAYSKLVIYHVHAGDLPNLENHLPAYQDLITLVLMNAPLVWTPGADVRHRIVTPLGTVEYSLSDRAGVERRMDNFRSVGLMGFEAQNLAFEYSRPKYRHAYYAAVRKCSELNGTIEDKLTRCSPLKTKAFTVYFRPHAPGTDERH